jgi:hypothetical protein
MPAQGIRAIGRIRDGGPWIGFEAVAGRYRVVAGRGHTTHGRDASTDVLLALAIAYFEEAFDDPPQELEAGHEDLGALVRDLAARERDPLRRELLAEAIDAIDDGLPGDAVANRLSAVRGRNADEQADPVDLLVSLAEELLRD